ASGPAGPAAEALVRGAAPPCGAPPVIGPLPPVPTDEPPVAAAALPVPTPVTPLVAEDVPGTGMRAPFCGTVETAPCCCCCACAAPAGGGPPFTAVTMASWVRRLPPQALTASVGRIAAVTHQRETRRTLICSCLPSHP